MAEEEHRTRLIADIASLISNERSMPDEARSAGLTLIGWLARRMPGEGASQAGVEVMHRRAEAHAGDRRSPRLNGRRLR